MFKHYRCNGGVIVSKSKIVDNTESGSDKRMSCRFSKTAVLGVFSLPCSGSGRRKTGGERKRQETGRRSHFVESGVAIYATVIVFVLS